MYAAFTIQLQERTMTKRRKLTAKPRHDVDTIQVARDTLRRYPKAMAKLAE